MNRTSYFLAVIFFLSTVKAYAAPETEMLIYERDGLLHDTDKKKDDGFFLDQPPPQNGNWVTPVNFRDGKLYFKILIRKVPTEIPNMVVKWNIWQDGGAENSTARYKCPAAAGTSVEFSSNTYIGLHEKPTPLDFSIPRKMYGIHFALNERGGPEMKGPALIKWHKWGRGKYAMEDIFPMDVKIMVVAVAKGAEFSGWQNYWKETQTAAETPQPFAPNLTPSDSE